MIDHEYSSQDVPDKTAERVEELARAIIHAWLRSDPPVLPLPISQTVLSTLIRFEITPIIDRLIAEAVAEERAAVVRLGWSLTMPGGRVSMHKLEIEILARRDHRAPDAMGGER